MLKARRRRPAVTRSARRELTRIAPVRRPGRATDWNGRRRARRRATSFPTVTRKEKFIQSRDVLVGRHQSVSTPRHARRSRVQVSAARAHAAFVSTAKNASNWPPQGRARLVLFSNGHALIEHTSYIVTQTVTRKADVKRAVAQAPADKGTARHRDNPHPAPRSRAEVAEF
ncbi:hypothetical protein EVAR_10207_1 [Eumeta japonica]|uniref:Uncharacterized protein n=1 Tax=Eumeta variegata TaxID=151549 RepID=A0A4C1TEG5_EUMVA|nr:hypothetical protein EVAR_10207_1 [Eumeta japonica]